MRGRGYEFRGQIALPLGPLMETALEEAIDEPGTKVIILGDQAMIFKRIKPPPREAAEQ